MAKSTRSKVKRAFRAKKRTEGVFAAADAARLQRLNSKLRALTSTTTADPGGEDGEEEEQDVDMPGSCWFAAFGLVDHQNISPAVMQSLGFASSAHSRHPINFFTRSPS
jgi:YBL028C ribosome biogenesis factor, N-terminal domain